MKYLPAPHEKLARLEDGLARLCKFGDFPSFDLVAKATKRIDALRDVCEADEPIPYRLTTLEEQATSLEARMQAEVMALFLKDGSEQRLAKVTACYPSDGDA